MAKSRKEEYINKEFTTKDGYRFKVVEYITNMKLKIVFEDGYSTSTSINSIDKGTIKTPYSPTVCGVGYLGVGNYVASINRKVTHAYETWHSMLVRCYDEKYKNRHETYIGCSVCREWHNFQTFAKWYEENYYQVDEERMCLDKDILVDGNKVYSPNTCIFVPNRINLLFTKRDKMRGDCVLGVFRNDRYKNKKFVAVCGNREGIQEKIGRFETEEEAFFAYKIFKENTIKEVAEMYKDKIPNELYITLKEKEVTC